MTTKAQDTEYEEHILTTARPADTRLSTTGFGSSREGAGMTVYIGRELDESGKDTSWEVKGISMRGLKTAATRSDFVRMRVTGFNDPPCWMLKTKRGWERFDFLEEMLAWERHEVA